MRLRNTCAATIFLMGATIVAAPSAKAAAPSAKTAVAEAGGSACRRLPRQRMVRLNLKPDTDVADLVAWISTITCKQFVVPGAIATSKRVTIFSPGLITAGEAYRLFLAALDSMGLTVYETGRFVRVIETPKAKTSGIPVYGFDDAPEGG